MDEVRVGVVDTDVDPGASRVAATVEAAGGEAVVDDSASLETADVTAIVTVGAEAFRSTAVRAPSAPILPVRVDGGLRSASETSLATAIDRLVADAYDLQRRALLSVTAAGGDVGRSYREVTLVSADPARISEFAIETATDGSIATVRADGVVVATPAGSHGYAGAGGGPSLSPATGLSIVPIAPFVTDPDQWVVPIERIELEVRRDETPIAIDVDGHERATIDDGDEVVLHPDGEFRVVLVDDGDPTVS